MLKHLSGNLKLLVIVGPTASGKTALALKLAEALNGEIICADSRTIYKGLDIGTAKPTKEEQTRIKHYGLDLISPGEKFSASSFKTMAEKNISDISRRDKLPIVVGGTGLYVDALIYDFSFAPKNSSKSVINPRHLEEGTAVSRRPLSDGVVIVGLNPGREVLMERIEVRAKMMFESGVVEETKQLVADYGWDSPGASGNIYQSLRPYIEGQETIEQAIERFIILDRQLAKRQMTWFKKNPDIQWFSDTESAASYIRGLVD